VSILLIERLRNMQLAPCDDAADEIERLQAQWDNSEREWAGLVEDWTQKLKRVAALEAENAGYSYYRVESDL
jgi:hypothetical protein